ncbi:uncharacterized protein LOC109200530 [Oreochromis niloticus]|uniref:uncharacterized protein LOC109200530 n=1 Tax=Oreochromis niloticus TaxID=8128 RepID=UPI000DF19966|nr:uncharacterized protein LOC109200530 [Oreochromis niloticus]
MTAASYTVDLVVSCPVRPAGGGEGGGRVRLCHPAVQNNTSQLITVHEFSNRNDDLITQDDLYRDRTKMNEDLLRTGDLSLTLKQPTERDTGGYICTIYRDKDILRQKVVLQVKEPFPSWSKTLLVLMILLVVSGGPLCHFCFMSVYKVEVDSGVESVQLPCKTVVNFLKDPKVEWKDRMNRKVHVYQNDSEHHDEQDQIYNNRK